MSPFNWRGQPSKPATGNTAAANKIAALRSMPQPPHYKTARQKARALA